MRAGFAIGRFGMKIVFQRVTHAPVRVDNQVIGKMGRGVFLCLWVLGIRIPGRLLTVL